MCQNKRIRPRHRSALNEGFAIFATVWGGTFQCAFDSVRKNLAVVSLYRVADARRQLVEFERRPVPFDAQLAKR